MPEAVALRDSGIEAKRVFRQVALWLVRSAIWSPARAAALNSAVDTVQIPPARAPFGSMR